MTRAVRAIALLIVVLPAGCTARGAPDPQPLAQCAAPGIDTSGWQMVDEGTFSFRLPPGFRKVPVQGVDSKVGRFRSADDAVELNYDWGWYSNDLSHDPATFSVYRPCSATIDEHEALVITGRLRNPSDGRAHVVAATWRNVMHGSVPVHLTIRVASQRPIGSELIALLHTVTLTPAGD